jgi:hypothetical protein
MKTDGLRTMRTVIRAEVLPEHDWEPIVAHELNRLALEIAAYRFQLDGRPGYAETETAINSLKAAQQAILGGSDSDQEQGSFV